VSRQQSQQQSHFRDWLRDSRLTGCAFAAQFGASDSALLFYEILDEPGNLDTDGVGAFYDLSAERGSVGVLLGPRMSASVTRRRPERATTR
jgi:hypothetical protein